MGMSDVTHQDELKHLLSNYHDESTEERDVDALTDNENEVSLLFHKLLKTADDEVYRDDPKLAFLYNAQKAYFAYYLLKKKEKDSVLEEHIIVRLLGLQKTLMQLLAVR